MRWAGRIAAGIVALTMTAGAAAAADMPMMVAPTAPPPVIVPAPGFDWAGTYVGGNFSWIGGPVAGAQFGFNSVNGRMVYGAEAGLGVVTFSPVFQASARARAGVLIGDQERLLLYGTGGLVFYFGGTTQLLWTVAGGVEFALGDRISVFAEAGIIGSVAPFGCCAFPGLRGGVNFHLGQ